MIEYIVSYGVTHLSIIPVRTTPSDKSELSTQLLFGEPYKVLQYSENKKWILIETALDQYRGWIDFGQFYEVTQEYFLNLTTQEKIFMTEDLITEITFNNHTFSVVRGSIIPLYTENNGEQRGQLGEGTLRVTGKIKKIEKKQSRTELLTAALQYWRAPYLWGGKTPFGIDCSGFTQLVFRSMGVFLKRDAYQQATQGVEIQRVNTETGDLAFFQREGRIVHVGIVVHPDDVSDNLYTESTQPEERYILHALDCVRLDKLDDTGIFHIERKIYTHNVHSMRKIAIPV